MRASEIQPRKLVVFDIDDTLVNTQTKVHVIKDGEVVNSLNSHDFTHYKLKPGESFDFEDFRNAREFFEKSKPIIPMMDQLKRDIATGNKVVMVTARADFDDKELFLDTFRKFGIDMGKVHVYRAGNSKEGTTEERKKAIIKNLLDKDDYTKAIMYDDAKPNLHTFIELKKDHPRTRFYAWHVNHNGEASEYMREGYVTEKKRKRKKPRWAAYGPGPYGGYGYAVGYSGEGGTVGEDLVNELNVSQTLKFIKDAHGDQLYGKLPYWTHPRSVALRGKKIFGSKFNSNAVKAAFLHDVVEDTHVGLEELSKLGFDKEVIEAVELLTKDKALNYKSNIEKIINSGNEIAMMVKYSDNYENFTGDKSSWDSKRADSSQKKYRMSLDMLGNVLGVDHHVNEGWKDWVGGAALGAAVAAGGAAGYDAYKSAQEPERISVSGKVQDKSNFEKGLIRIAKDAVPKKSVTDSPHEKLLTKAAVAAGITGEELAQFLAQTAHETMGFKHMVEIGGASHFRKYEPKFVKDKKGKLVQVNPKAKTLGNTKKGDGVRYKGRGYIQLTGKYNYKRAGEALGLDLVNNPELVEKPEVAAKVAIWFWQNRVQPRVDDFYDTRASTRPINPGLKGLEDRKEKFKDFKLSMK